MIRERNKLDDAILRTEFIKDYPSFLLVDDEYNNTDAFIYDWKDDEYLYYIQYCDDGVITLWRCGINDTFNIMRERCHMYKITNVDIKYDILYDKVSSNI